MRRAGLPSLHFDESVFDEAFWRDPSGAVVLAEECDGQRRVFDLIAHAPAGRMFALVGERGVGKTRLAAACVVQKCVEETFLAEDATPGRPLAMFRSVMELFFDLRAAYGEKATDSESSVIRRYFEPEMLVLDDMQDRGGTEWEQRTLAVLIDKRYRERKDTILIANIEPGKFDAHVGAAIADRLSECGGVVECGWRSFRSPGEGAA